MATEANFDPLAILRAMCAHEVPLIVIGGFAVAAHKVVRATRDLDVVTDRSWNAAQRLADALRSLDADHERVNQHPPQQHRPHRFVERRRQRAAVAEGLHAQVDEVERAEQLERGSAESSGRH